MQRKWHKKPTASTTKWNIEIKTRHSTRGSCIAPCVRIWWIVCGLHFPHFILFEVNVKNVFAGTRPEERHRMEDTCYKSSVVLFTVNTPSIETNADRFSPPPADSVEENFTKIKIDSNHIIYSFDRFILSSMSSPCARRLFVHEKCTLCCLLFLYMTVGEDTGSQQRKSGFRLKVHRRR